MSVYKQLLAQDITVTPFEVNKSFTFYGASQLTDSDVNIDRFLGTNINSYLFNPNSDPTTGQISTQYQRLIYNSVKELYYSNYLSSSYGSPAPTSSILPGSDPSGDVLVGNASSEGRYFNYPQTSLTFEKYFPTASDAVVGVLSIPSRLFGNYILPNSFNWNADNNSIHDDGEGNLIFSSSGEICGQIFYPHGLAIITSDSNPGQDGYSFAIYGTSSYGVSDVEIINTFVTSSNVTCSFISSYPIFETQYKCTIRESEFNFSQNKTLLSGSSDEVPYNFTTGSYFAPYITTVGLYDDNQNLIAVGKLAQPLPSSRTTDMTIFINIDK